VLTSSLITRVGVRMRGTTRSGGPRRPFDHDLGETGADQESRLHVCE
jgi:hypothetical protein